MAINVKNPRAVAAVKRLAAHCGLSYTAAIEMAAEAALKTPSPSNEQEALKQIHRITTEYRAHLPETTTLDQGALYDEAGLYR